MESEFLALIKIGKEAEWLRNLLYEIYNEKSRHTSLKHEYMRKLIEHGVIFLTYVKSSVKT